MVKVYDGLNLKIVDNSEELTLGMVTLENIDKLKIEGMHILLEYNSQIANSDDGFELKFDVNFKNTINTNVPDKWYSFPASSSSLGIDLYKKVFSKGVYNIFYPLPFPAYMSYLRINFKWNGLLTNLSDIYIGLVSNAFLTRGGN